MIYIHEMIVDFPCHRALWSLRTFVNINLCATLFIAQLIFVVGIDQTSNEASHHQLCVREFDASYVVLCTGWLCHCCHTAPLFLPRFIHVDANGRRSALHYVS